MAEYPDTEIGRICDNIIGFSVNQASALNANGWEDLSDLSGYTTSDIESWVTSISRLAVNRGGVTIASVRIRRLCALNYWVNRRILRGVDPIEEDFDAATLATAQADYPIDDMKREATDSVTKPESFVYDKWVDWQDSVITYLKGKKNVTKTIPLYYVIRPLLAPVHPSEEDEIVFNANHVGAAFSSDNTTVHQILTELTNGTDADQWIKQHRRSQDGRAAWIGLCNHYDGPAEGDKRVAIARHDIKIVHYRNESSFSFEKYSTRLKSAFTTLATYNQPKSEVEKVEILLDQINTNDARLVTSIGICRDQHATTYEDACTYLSKEITTIYPQHQPNAFGKRGKGGKKLQVRGVHAVKTKGGKTTCNGVDLSDTTKYYSKFEFHKMGKEGRDYLNKCPKRKASRAQHESNKRSRNSSAVTTGDETSQRHIAAIINGVMQATRHENDSVSGSQVPSQVGGNADRTQMPQHGPHARSIANISTGSQRSQTQYDHNGNIIP
jgi:hypothetical protein